MEKEKIKHCAAPFRSVYLNDGIASPCCWYDRKSLKNFDQNLETIKDTFSSEEFNLIRKNMYKDSLPKECKKCILHDKMVEKATECFGTKEKE